MSSRSRRRRAQMVVFCAVSVLSSCRLQTESAEHEGARSPTHLVVAPSPPQQPAEPAASPSSQRDFRVCADPNNMPFSNRDGEGFENALADFVARQLDERVTYTWWPERRGFIRNTLDHGDCDVVMGVPAEYERAQTTVPYYRSTYVFVTRRTAGIRLSTLDDPRLRRLRIGLHVIGDDYENVPAARALAARGIVDNLRGYSIYGDYSQPDPPRNVIDAVARDDIDVAIVWGPLGGYFAGREAVPLDVTRLVEHHEPSGTRFTFAISMGVRHGNTALKARLDQIITVKHHEIRRILERFDVPVLDDSAAAGRVARGG